MLGGKKHLTAQSTQETSDKLNRYTFLEKSSAQLDEHSKRSRFIHEVPFADDRNGLFSVRFNNDSSKIISSFGNGVVEVLDVESGEFDYIVKSESSQSLPIMCVRCIPAIDDTFFAAGISGNIYICKFEERSTKHFAEEKLNEINSIDIDIGSTNLVSVGKDANVRIYDVKNAKLKQRYSKQNRKADDNSTTHFHATRVFAAKFHPTEEHIFLTGGSDDTVKGVSATLESSSSGLISLRSVNKISSDVEKGNPLASSKRKRDKKKPVVDINNLTGYAIRNAIYDMYRNKQHITLKSLRSVLRERDIFMGSQTSLWNILRNICFHYRKDEPRKALMELPHIALKRVWDMRIQEACVKNISGPRICGEALDVKDKHILTGSWTVNNSLQIWDMISGRLIENINPINRLQTLDGEFLYCCQYFKGEGYEYIIAGGSGTSRLEVISIKDQKIVSSYKTHKTIQALDSNSQSFVVFGGMDPIIKVLNVV